MDTLKIKVILGSTRPNRFGDKPAKWIFEEVKKLPDIEAEFIDLRDVNLPMFDQPKSPSQANGDYGSDTVNAWAKTVADADAFVIVSPEYNHGPSAVLKNALDSVYGEWNNKAVGFVSYGSVGGARAVEQLRLIAIELQMAPVRTAIHIPWNVMGPILMGQAEWTAETGDAFGGPAKGMLGQLTMWGRALKAARNQ